MGENLLEEEFKAEALSQMGNPLEKLASLVDFEMFRPALEDVVIKKKCKRQCNLASHIILYISIANIVFNIWMLVSVTSVFQAVAYRQPDGSPS